MLQASKLHSRVSGASEAPGFDKRVLALVGAILCSCLFLQRFGFPAGAKNASIVGPIGIGLAGWGLLSGVFAFDSRRLVIFLALTFCAVLGAAWHAVSPGPFSTPLNVQSISQFLLLTAFATLTFSEPVDELRFFRLLNFLFMLAAAAGTLQFIAQFAGIRIFAFTGLLPESILFESGYNLQILAGVGDLLKSNGFFLVEPSVFSQLMALALIVEILAFKRLPYLAIFVTGLLLSMSGTGWIVLATFVVAAVFSMGARGVVIAAATVATLAVALAAGLLLAPDLALAIQDRMDEFSRPGTSGHMRFVTPFWVLSDIIRAEPSAALLGIGAGASEQQNLVYSYDVNTPVKIILEYGGPALIAYILLFVVGQRSAIQSALVAPCLALILFTGGYQQFPPILFLVMMLTSVARLRRA
ncbi:hypothetical protein [Roseomonas sp. BN140053]|uniref:hypothetical protein n=1 Tax=Roseomonas sp. BN140053 TaxID=3391898 RepID=UPI0039EB7074